MEMRERYGLLPLLLCGLLVACENKTGQPDSGGTVLSPSTPSTPTVTPSTPSIPVVTPSTPSTPVSMPTTPVASVDAVCSHPISSGALKRIDQLRAQNKPVVIVALGSSSTQGAGASQPGLGYVEQLQLRLQAAWGAGSVTVINKGIGGDTLAREMARLNTDVYPNNPDLIILQTGVNDALQQIDQATFSSQLDSIITDFTSRKLDILMLGGQYLPFPPNSYNAYMETIEKKALGQSIFYVSRQQIAASLFKTGLKSEDIVSSDGLHPNDFMHACTATAITSVITHSN